MIDAALATMSQENHILVFLYTLRIHQRRGMATVETYAFGLELVLLLLGVDMNETTMYKFSYNTGSLIRDLLMYIMNQLSTTSHSGINQK